MKCRILFVSHEVAGYTHAAVWPVPSLSLTVLCDNDERPLKSVFESLISSILLDYLSSFCHYSLLSLLTYNVIKHNDKERRRRRWNGAFERGFPSGFSSFVSHKALLFVKRLRKHQCRYRMSHVCLLFRQHGLDQQIVSEWVSEVELLISTI